MKLSMRVGGVLGGLLASLWCLAVAGAEPLPGADVAGLLVVAREGNPEYALQRYEAEAAAERVEPAGALPDPRLRTELMDITRGGQQSPTLLPARTGSTRYTLMQEIPWFGKRDLKREIAQLEADGARGRAFGTWSEVVARIKTTHAQRYYLERNESLSREILALMGSLERIAQSRYAGGLAAQQDVLRAQVEQTAMRNELIALDMEQHHLATRLNALLGRPPHAPLARPETLPPLPPPERLDHDALEARARNRNPMLAVDDHRIRAAERSRDLAYRNRYPDVTLGVVPNQMQNQIMQWDLMVEVNIPLQQASRRAQEREAEVMLSAARVRREATANQLLADLAESLSALEAARRSAELTEGTLLPQADAGFRAALVGYENGKVDFATVLEAQRQIRQARLNLIKYRAEAQVRLADIERIVGEEL